MIQREATILEDSDRLEEAGGKFTSIDPVADSIFPITPVIMAD